MFVQWGDFIWVVGDKVHVETKRQLNQMFLKALRGFRAFLCGKPRIIPAYHDK